LGEEYKSFSSSVCSLLHSPVTSSLLVPNILLNTIFSNTLSFLSSLNVSEGGKLEVIIKNQKLQCMRVRKSNVQFKLKMILSLHNYARWTIGATVNVE